MKRSNFLLIKQHLANPLTDYFQRHIGVVITDPRQLYSLTDDVTQFISDLREIVAGLGTDARPELEPDDDLDDDAGDRSVAADVAHSDDHVATVMPS